MPISFTGQQQFSYFLSRHLENVPNVTSSHLQTLPNYCLQVKHLYWFKVNVPESLVKSELRKFHSFIKRLGRKSQLRLNTRIIKCLSLQNIITGIVSKLIFVQQIFTNSVRCSTHIISFKLSEEILVQILK